MSESADVGGPDSGARVAITRPRHLSPSSASTFRQCPRRWKFRYVDRLPDPKGIPALVGTFVHRVLEELLVLDPTDRTLDRARALAGELWPETAEDPDFVALELGQDAARGVRWDAWRLVENYFAMEDPTLVRVADREQRLDVDLDGVPFLGIVDRTEFTETGIRVTDYKTGKAPRERYVADKLDQVWLYAAALGASGRPVDEVRLMYLTGVNVDRPVEPAAVAAAVARHSETWNDIGRAVGDDSFPFKLGPLCGWCPYIEHCEEGRLEVERRRGPLR